MSAHWTDALVGLSACEEAVEWARTQPDLATAWAVCERADWLLWLASRVCGDGDDLHRAPCGCVRVAAPDASLDRQRYLRREAWMRSYRYETHTGPDAQRILRETWTCGDEHCAFQAAVRAEEGR